MLFANKSKGYFVDWSAGEVMVASATQFESPLVIETLARCETGDAEALKAIIEPLVPSRGSGFLESICAIYPPKRQVRKILLDLKKSKEPGYFEELVTGQLRIDVAQYLLTTLQLPSGKQFLPGESNAKELVVCGMPKEDIVTSQEMLLEAGIYPNVLELGSVSIIGGLIDYLKTIGEKSPILVLEVGDEATFSYILSANGLEATRPIPQGLASMVPIVQKELGLKDEDAARKLFFSNTFDFTGMGPVLVRRLMRELQSSIGFFEVQTGQSVGGVFCSVIPSKQAWLEEAVAKQLMIEPYRLKLAPWLEKHGIRFAENLSEEAANPGWLRLFTLMIRENGGENKEA